MTLAEDMPDRAVLVAIDVAKHGNEILIEVPGRTRTPRRTVSWRGEMKEMGLGDRF